MDLAMETMRQNKIGEAFGLSKPFAPKHYRQFAGARWFAQEDIDQYVGLLKQASHRGDLKRMGAALEKRMGETRKGADEIARLDVRNASWEELEEAFQRFCQIAIDHWFQIYHYIFLGYFLPDEVTAEVAAKVPDPEQQSAYLLTLFSSDKPTEMREENLALLQLAEKIHKEKLDVHSPVVEELIENHLQKYAHLGRYYFRSKPYSGENIVSRIEHLTAEDIARKKKEFAEQRNLPQKAKEILRELELSKETTDKAYDIKQYAYCSNLGDECYNYLVHQGAGLLQEIARRLECTWDELTAMRHGEILEALRKKEPLSPSKKNELRERIKDHAILLEHGHISILTGEALKGYYAREAKAEEKFTHLKEFKGLAASHGKATGQAKVIRNIKELDKVRKGDILVTAMTTPEFVPAMERAAAIVTDEGGMLCHAAIVSRELHCPCIVGTKVATKALKDGERIEVDAVKGIVRKL